MTGPLLTTATPEAAPGELFAGNAATLKSNNYSAIFAASFVGGVIQTSNFSKQTSSASVGCDVNARRPRGSALRRTRVFQLRECLQPRPSSEPLQCHVDIKGSLLK